MKPLTRLKTIGLYRLTENTVVGNDMAKCVRIDNEDIKTFFPTDEKPPQNLTAKWLGLLENINDEVPPLNAGKEVIIFRHRDTGEYYWFFVFSTLDESAVHTKGTRYFRFSNDDEAEELNNDNSYSMLIDNIEKIVSLHTAKNDGEETTWDMKIDTKAGLFELFDDKGNNIKFDSATELLGMVFNNDIKLETKIFNLKSSDLINMETKEYVSSTETLDIDASKSITVKTKKHDITDETFTHTSKDQIIKTETLNMDSSKSIKLNTLDIDLTTNILLVKSAKSIKVDSPLQAYNMAKLSMTATDSMTFNAKHFDINNGTENLISVLTDLLNVLDSSVYITSSGTTSDPDGGTKSAFAGIKSRLEAYK